jgi:non-homologous end joining protein Ku
VVDLVAALRASVEAAKQRREGKETGGSKKSKAG